MINLRLSVYILTAILMPGIGTATESEDCVVAPEISAMTIDNVRIALSDPASDRPVYLKFWLSTCPQCIAEMPHFVHTYELYGDDFQFVAVNLGLDGDTPEVVRSLMAEYELEMPMVVDDSGELRRVFGVGGTPTHVVIDRDGRIVHSGNAADDALDETLACLHTRLQPANEQQE